MAEETEILRPFQGLDRFGPLLDKVEVVFGDQTVSPGRSITIENPLDYLSRQLTINIPFGTADDTPDQELTKALDEAGLQLEEVDLLVTSTTDGLRRCDKIEQINLAKAPVPTSIPILDRKKFVSLRAPTHGADIEVMLVVSRERGFAFAAPHQKGTWLGRARFTLLTAQPGRGFQVLPLDDGVRRVHGLGGETHWFIDIVDEVDLRQDDRVLGDCLRIYVAPKLLNRLQVNLNTPDADYVQWQMFIDAVRALTTRILQDCHPNEPLDLPPDGSPFRHLLTLRTGDARPKEEDLEAALERFGTPERFIADIAENQSFLKTVHGALANPE
jgi:hypothetical protein